MPSDAQAAEPGGTERLTFFLKWASSILQIFAYGATSFGFTPINVYLFVIGVVGWFAVGVLWKDRAIMLIHLVAFIALVAGISAS
ncbi:ubiquinone biosynthesis methyltransferase UbiE [Rhizobiales bacterium]|uniref:DUF6552 family protein n=1 Tax=Hongsoonwoonella zoysiae TaxID=2821844 RepID=UPI001560EB14|nr:DUF6552 family protein [Hongsoonwoonella zoysiae]NRG19143.1 ubiquinone biosynthesis methyltransferase UbiE [Hongsoonwoonella zoysiae]